MKRLIIFFITLFAVSTVIGQTYSTGDGEWGSVVSSSTLGSYYDIGASENYAIIHNVYTTSTGIDGLLVGAGGILTVGDGVAGGTDSLTVNGDLGSGLSSDITVHEGDVLVVTGNLGNGFDGNIVINGTLKVIGGVINAVADMTVGTNGIIQVGGDFVNAGGNVTNNGEILVGGTYIGGSSGNPPQDELGESSALPISLISFNALQKPSAIVISWSTASELNNDYFTIERSNNGSNFSKIGTVKGVGTASTETNYSFTDNYPKTGINYYRLTQTDFNGNSETFVPVSVMNTLSTSFKVWPNPADTRLVISIGEINVDGEITMYNSIGAIVKSIPISEFSGTIDVSDYHAGLYILKISSAGTDYTQRILIK